MNLFLLHPDPKINAWLHHDKHVVKMILETAQIVSTVAYDRGQYAPYKPTHRKHPVTLWVAENDDHLNYIIHVGMHLSMEYSRRFGKVHKSSLELEKMCRHMIDGFKKYSKPECFVQCFPDEYKHDDPFQGYRDYYVAEKLFQSNWR